MNPKIARCPNCCNKFSTHGCTAERCVVRAELPPPVSAEEFGEMCLYLGEDAYLGVLDRWGFSSIADVMSPKLRRLIYNEMRKHAMEIFATPIDAPHSKEEVIQ